MVRLDLYNIWIFYRITYAINVYVNCIEWIARVWCFFQNSRVVEDKFDFTLYINCAGY